MVQVFRLVKAVGKISIVYNCSDFVFVEHVINVEVIVNEDVVSKFCSRWAFAKEVGYCFFCHLAGWAEVSGRLVDSVEVFVQSAVSRNEVKCGTVAIPVVDEVCVDLLPDGLRIAASYQHIRMCVFVRCPGVVAELVDFVVDFVLDVRLWYGDSSDVLTCCTKFG